MSAPWQASRLKIETASLRRIFSSLRSPTYRVFTDGPTDAALAAGIGVNRGVPARSPEGTLNFGTLLEAEARGFATTHAHIRPWVIRPQRRGGWNESATLPRFGECCAYRTVKSKLNNASPEFGNSMRGTVIERD